MEMNPRLRKSLGFISILTTASKVRRLFASFAVGGERKMEKRKIIYRNIVDLSHPITLKIPLWPGDPDLKFETMATLEKDGYYLRRFSMGEHSATHMNAPNSFDQKGAAIDTYAPQSLVRPAVVIDIRRPCRQNPDHVVSTQDVMQWEKEHGGIEPGSIVIFYTGWQERWDSPQDFFNTDADGGLHFPGIGGQTTQFLLQQRKIAGVGIDTHGVDPGQDEQYAATRQVLADNGIVLECLTNLGKLPPKGATVAIGLLKLQAGSGSPVAVLAFVP
jgi:kynurenine formamidase